MTYPKIEPNNEITTTTATPATSSIAGRAIRSGHQWPIRPVMRIRLVYIAAT